MTEYLIYFNQQWVGDHTEEWFRGRAPLAMAVVEEMKAAGVYVFAGGLEEEAEVFSADATTPIDRPHAPDRTPPAIVTADRAPAARPPSRRPGRTSPSTR